MKNSQMKEWLDLGDVSILSVEDDSFNQELASAIFEEIASVTVVQAANGKEALEVLSTRKIDVILLDLMMPIMNGFKTLEILKNSEEYKSIPVIILTSKDEEKRSTYKLGANDFISKPYNPIELKLRVFNHLNIKRFSDILSSLEKPKDGQNVTSMEYLQKLQKLLKIADHSKKTLLERLGTMTHECSDKIASQRLGNYISLFAKLYGINSKDIDNLFYVMSIYDIGLLRIPKDKLINTDTKMYKEHPKLGMIVLDGVEETDLIKIAKTVTLNHHEHWDGSGYPKGIKGKEIPLYARLSAVIDYFDELTFSRCYNKHTLNSSDALEVMKRERGIKLDPELLDIFIANFDKILDIKNKFS
ncbi:MAG: hypothetical protein DRG30_00705 [Epsilonproteobacteria bacterium]|nr:MAG: hypothetical protein DRG30_00705 [Campylobacterota bacterium]